MQRVLSNHGFLGATTFLAITACHSLLNFWLHFWLFVIQCSRIQFLFGTTPIVVRIVIVMRKIPIIVAVCFVANVIDCTTATATIFVRRIFT